MNLNKGCIEIRLSIFMELNIFRTNLNKSCIKFKLSGNIILGMNK